ncbi:MAG: alpha/beta fold hydrolase [Bacteriodetes bacterium]|nr:alpha/beta fold hydrolase [Bacteroidota bacterium]
MKLNTMFSSLRVLLGIALMISLVLSSCKTGFVPELPSLPSAEKVQTTHIAYPILLLHGLGQKSHVWDDQAVRFYQNEMGLAFGGVLSMKNGKANLDAKYNGSGDFFTVSFTNSSDSIATWGRELEQYVNLVRQKTKADKVILIGYSMGGVASRYYLTHHVKNHNVVRLITIGSPHLGSPFARIYKLKAGIVSKLKENPNPVTATILKGALSTVEAAESDVPFDAPAMHDLMRPEDGGTFLDALNKSEHPGDVEYVCVVGDVDVASEVQKLNTTAVQEILRRAVEFFDSGLSAVFSTGDGVVSSYSQTLNNIAYFKNNPSRQRLTRTVTLSSLHTEHLRNSNEIQRVTLEDKPEFKSAEFYGYDGKPCLVIDFSDYLPPQKSTVTVTYPSLTGERTITASDVQLIRKPNNDVVCRAIIPLPDADYSSAFDAQISITNYFSNKITTSKRWNGK